MTTATPSSRPTTPDRRAAVRLLPGLALAGAAIAAGLLAHRWWDPLPALPFCVALGVALANLTGVRRMLVPGLDLAAGWLLREAGKTEARRLETYLLAQGPRIPRTTVRYAIERFPEIKRRKILEKTRVQRVAADISNRKGKSQK